MKVIDKSKGIRKNIDIIAIAEQKSDRISRGTEEGMKSSRSDEGKKESRAKEGKGFEGGFSSGNTGAGVPRGARSSIGSGLDPKLGSGITVPTGGH